MSASPPPASPTDFGPGGPPPPDPLAERVAVLAGSAVEAVAADTPDVALPGHSYDGIREYDNPMPGWWLALFWATILFAPLYMLGVHVFDWINDYGDDYAARGQELTALREAYAASGAFSDTPAALAEYMADAGRVADGAAVFGTVCAACHGPDGGGTIGPNLTDDFWIHGATPALLWTGLAEGYPEKGMPAWKDQLSDEERASLLAYIKSIQGTSPAAPKAPQGDPATL